MLADNSQVERSGMPGKDNFREIARIECLFEKQKIPVLKTPKGKV